jgi:signal peptidase I
MFFLTPKYLKQGRLYLKEARKRLAYNRDKWEPAKVDEFQAVTDDLQKAVKAKDREGIKAGEDKLEALCNELCPQGNDAWITENVEVFLVAFIVALGIRTYILQPFTIPTSSMFPTLCGVMGTKTEQEPPNAAVQVWDFITYGRTWHNVVAEEDEQLMDIREEGRGGWRRLFTYTAIHTMGITSKQEHVYYVNELMQPVQETWGLLPGRTRFQKGQPIVRGYTTTGDHVFVDKISYHFRTPKRGEVIVFSTADIEGQGMRGAPPRQPSQFYIKRLGGEPGDTLRINAPKLYVNGEEAKEWTFQRVMQGDQNPNGDYHGYSNALPGSAFMHLGTPEESFTVPPHQYFALGDNSYHSWDSRGWGTVPEHNFVGPGMLVYWPFCREKGTHFGVIR